MMRFVYGNTGSGKTAWIVAQIMEDLRHGFPVILLVPEQQSMETELLLSERAEHEGISTVGLEVLSFSRLANRVFREYGGLSYRYIDRGGRALLMWHTLYRLTPVLEEYRNIRLTDRSVLQKLLRAVDSFAQYGATPAMLEETAQRLEEEEENDRLCRKLRDMALLFASYRSLLQRDYDDPTDDLTRLAQTLRAHAFFAGRRVYLDSFYGFTGCEYAVIEQILAQSELVTVSLSYCPDSRLGIFAPLRRTDRDLRAIAARQQIAFFPDTVLREPIRFASPALGQLEQNLWDYAINSPLTADKPEGIALRACANLFEEAETVAREILRQVRAGARFRDHVVIARELGRYHGVIDAVFERYGIPYFWSERVEITEKPLIRLILSSLAVIAEHWKCDDVLSCAKTGLLPLTDEECDILENYTTVWAISGWQWLEDEPWSMNPDGYVPLLTERGRTLLQRVNEVRFKLTAPLSALGEALHEGCTVRECCEALCRYLEELSVCEKIEAQGDREAIALWNTVMDALDQLVALFPEACVNADIFSQLLRLLFESTDFGRIPTAMDQVLIGSASGIRVQGAAHAYLLGANDGIFPANVDEDGLFSDRELIAMEGVGLSLSPTADLRADEELLCFYRAVSAVSHSVTVTYALADPNGAALRPSEAVNRMLTLFPALGAHLHREETDPLSSVLSPYDLLDLTVRYAGSAFGEAAKAVCMASPMLAAQLEALDRPIEDTAATVSRETVNAIFPQDLRLSQTRLESYVMCGFSYYCRYVLKLEPQQRAEFRPLEVGNFVHRILEVFFRRISTPEGLRHTLSDAETDRLLDEVIEDYMHPLMAQMRVGVRRLQHLFRRLRRTTRLLVHNLLDEFAQSKFVPTFFELPIAEGNPEGVEPLHITLADGTTTSIYGKVDRVDTYRRGKDVYVRVVDYKTGSRDFSLSDVEKGLNLQMLLYLFSLWKNAEPLFRRRIGAEEGEILPAGVLYLSARSPELSLERELSPDEVLALADKKLQRRGLLLDDPEVLRAMEDPPSARFIPVSLKNGGDGYAAGAPVASLATFGALADQVTDTVRRIAESIRAGNANAVPYRSGKQDACAYCPMKPICRRF